MDIYTDFDYTDEEIALLKEHDEGEELHSFVPEGNRCAHGHVSWSGNECGICDGEGIPPVNPGPSWYCAECGDDSSGLMHDNTWRNVEPLMPVTVESPSGWSYMSTQENGDRVDCWSCGDPLDDDFPIVNDDDGYALHEPCLEDDHEPYRGAIDYTDAGGNDIGWQDSTFPNEY